MSEEVTLCVLPDRYYDGAGGTGNEEKNPSSLLSLVSRERFNDLH